MTIARPVLALVLKLTLAPALVATATQVAGRLGHRAGGLVGGLPVVAGPILLIYAVEQGQAFAAEAAAGAVLGIVSLVGFCVAYALAARRHGTVDRAGRGLGRVRRRHGGLRRGRAAAGGQHRAVADRGGAAARSRCTGWRRTPPRSSPAPTCWPGGWR